MSKFIVKVADLARIITGDKRQCPKLRANFTPSAYQEDMDFIKSQDELVRRNADEYVKKKKHAK